MKRTLFCKAKFHEYFFLSNSAPFSVAMWLQEPALVQGCCREVSKKSFCCATCKLIEQLPRGLVLFLVRRTTGVQLATPPCINTV